MLKLTLTSAHQYSPKSTWDLCSHLACGHLNLALRQPKLRPNELEDLVSLSLKAIRTNAVKLDGTSLALVPSFL